MNTSTEGCVLIVCVTILFILFGGSPDIADAIMAAIK